MGILSILSDMVQPITNLVDELHTSDEEKLKIKQAMATLDHEYQKQILNAETKALEAQAKNIQAEATGQSWMQCNWRPITMLTFLSLVVLDSFGWLENRLADEAWTLLQIGLGGYVVGRSAEKVTHLAQRLK